MGKRKIGEVDSVPGPQVSNGDDAKQTHTIEARNASTQVQIITGSYDKVLHGLVASISIKARQGTVAAPSVDFRDNFLFNAHSSAIRSLAVSPISTAARVPTVTLASGGTDERINLYQLSARAAKLAPSAAAVLPGERPTIADPRNKEVGSLLHHGASVTALHFATRAKLLSGAADNTIAVARARDWTVLSSFKAPLPKAAGRPSGDTAPPGEGPAGINDLAVHPSLKLMVSVGRGEKCMRLWNLVTGKKAGVLSFGRETLRAVGEGKWALGEGRRVTWNGRGDEFAVAFEYGAVVYGMDCQTKYVVLPTPRTKLHQIRFVPSVSGEADEPGYVAVSTEDGRVLFFVAAPDVASNQNGVEADAEMPVPACKLVGQLGGKAQGVTGRIKDLEILDLQLQPDGAPSRLVIAAGSDGVVRLWLLDESRMSPREKTQNGGGGILNGTSHDAAEESDPPKKAAVPQAGEVIGVCETSNRITCLKAFILLDRPEEDGEGPKDEIGDSAPLEESIGVGEELDDEEGLDDEDEPDEDGQEDEDEDEFNGLDSDHE